MCGSTSIISHHRLWQCFRSQLQGGSLCVLNFFHAPHGTRSINDEKCFCSFAHQEGEMVLGRCVGPHPSSLTIACGSVVGVSLRVAPSAHWISSAALNTVNDEKPFAVLLALLSYVDAWVRVHHHHHLQQRCRSRLQGGSLCTLNFFHAPHSTRYIVMFCSPSSWVDVWGSLLLVTQRYEGFPLFKPCVGQNIVLHASLLPGKIWHPNFCLPVSFRLCVCMCACVCVRVNASLVSLLCA